ncbi:endonuclease/exonuclease/phosphatase family protein [Streptomyces sp. NPDC058659]|uniref:endonuclease/exonuclease/phosphatase family protein n=1 Tax=unclassified Streptomyces TaxID=2593676 RepID=UPI0036494CE8
MRRSGALRALTAVLALMCAGLVLTAPQAQADTVGPSTAPPVRTYTYNMCGSGGTGGCDVSAAGNEARYDTIVDETAAGVWNADYLFLVEVCRYQFDDLNARLGSRGYTGRYVETVPAGNLGSLCKDPVGSTTPSYGMATFVRGVVVDGVDLTLDTRAAILNTVPGSNAEDIKAPCVKARVQYRQTWACSVHLWWGLPTLPADPTTQQQAMHAVMAREADKLAAQAKAWEDAGIPVVLGGDFNSSPWGDVLDRFYEAGAGEGGHGTFAEADETDADRFGMRGALCAAPVARCRSGQLTKLDAAHTARKQKLDYTFFSSRYFRGEVGDVPPEPTTPTAGKWISDHLPIRGAAYWEDCGAYGATSGAVFRRDAVGGLYRYAGRADGADAALAMPCKVGTGWKGMKLVARQGTTLAAVDAAGDLWHYQASPADGSYSGGSGRTAAGTGFGNDNVLLAPGDVDGDTVADLITRDTTGGLWLHKGTGAHGYAPRTPIADTGGDGSTWATYRSVVAVDFDQDLTGPKAADLVAIDDTGRLWLHRGNGDGTLSARQAIGTSWNVYDALVAPGDLDGDGKPDLVGREAGGDLYSYKGNGTGGYAPRVKAGSSFPSGELLF